MSELDEIQCCLGCGKRINLLETDEKAGFRCLDCQFYFCRPAVYHFNLTDERPSDAAKRDAEIERLWAELERERNTCGGCGQVADGWGVCDCAHEIQKEKRVSFRAELAAAKADIDRLRAMVEVARRYLNKECLCIAFTPPQKCEACEVLAALDRLAGEGGT